MSNTSEVTVEELAELKRQKSIDLIDVRTPAEFQEIHAVGARNVPLNALDPEQFTKSHNVQSSDPLYVICQSGTRSASACKQLCEAGCDNVVSVRGGTKAWESAGLPVNRGRKTISLERQVRITAGFLTLLGAVLALTVHVSFAGLSAFIGAGLIFAGITDTCGMAMVLAAMPWNNCGTECSSHEQQVSQTNS